MTEDWKMQRPPAGPSRGISLDWIRTVRLVEAVRQIAGGFLYFRRQNSWSTERVLENCKGVSPNTGQVNLHLDLEDAAGTEDTKVGTGPTLTVKDLISYITLGSNNPESIGHIH